MKISKKILALSLAACMTLPFLSGCGDTAAFCRMLKEKGVEPKAMGVEVISDAILAKGVAAAAKFNFDNTVKVLEEGWPEAMPEK